MNKLISKYNTSESLIVISSYPSLNSEAAKLNAVACYARNLINSYKHRPIIVLAEDIDGKEKVWEKDNVLVIHCWKPGSPLLFLNILNVLRSFNYVKDVLIQFEFNMLGSVILTSLLPFFIGNLRVLGKKVNTVQHQVVEDLSELSGHLNIKKSSFKARLLNSGLRLFYLLTGWVSNSIIVHEAVLKKRLSKWISSNKIFVISHGLSLAKKDNKKRKKYRQKLGVNKGEMLLLVFGYITWYKGTDWIIEKLAQIRKEEPNKNIKLLVAGGASATLKSKSHYKRYLDKIEKLVEQNKDFVSAVGYVPDKDVQGYFEASDLVVLPYRTLMSASGPLSFALKYNKPYIMSGNLSASLNNQDVNSVLKKLSLSKKDIIFHLNKNSLKRKLYGLELNRSKLSSLENLVADVRVLRSWDSIVLQYEKVIDTADEKSYVGLRKILSKTFA